MPYNINLNMMDPAFRYEQKTAINTQVPNPFKNYLTVDKFPGALRNTSTVTIASLLVPYPQYGSITQTNTDGKKATAHTFEVRAQRPFVKGLSFLASYAYSNEQVQQWFDDVANYQVLTSGGQDGWQWQPYPDVPRHRFTGAITWQIPVGKDRHWGSDMPTALDLVVGGWQYSLATRRYSGRPLLFGNYLVSGNPKLDNPTRDKWFDTSMFKVADAYTPRSNPAFYDGLNGPGWGVTDMTLTKMFNMGSRYRLEARIEAYNAFNNIIWDNPDLSISSSNFGKVTRKRGRARTPGGRAVHLPAGAASRHLRACETGGRDVPDRISASKAYNRPAEQSQTWPISAAGRDPCPPGGGSLGAWSSRRC